MSKHPVPDIPQVIPASPTGTEPEGDSYFPPTTRSAKKKKDKSQDSDSDLDRRARSRDRSPQLTAVRRRPTSDKAGKTKTKTPAPVQKSEPLVPNGLPNGFLSPASAASTVQYYWREISRSPSPLGLIPIHVSWRSFIHRHEVPRKALHVSIGFMALLFYHGREAGDVHPWLLALAVPITLTDVIRHKSASFNRFYVRVLGALMRETEVHEKYNGVIFYLIGAWAVLRFLPKDVAVLSILLLSWCDTAASTIGRMYGKYTPRIRKGKSLAGSMAAAAVGFATCIMFYGFFIPRQNGIEDSFMFRGSLKVPASLPGMELLGADMQLAGWSAYIVLSLVTGLIASMSEAVDLYGIDDNFTIPVLSGLGLWIFLKVFG